MVGHSVRSGDCSRWWSLVGRRLLGAGLGCFVGLLLLGQFGQDLEAQSYNVVKLGGGELGVSIDGVTEAVLELGVVTDIDANISAFQLMFQFDPAQIYAFQAELPDGHAASWFSFSFAQEDIPPIPNDSFAATGGSGYASLIYDFQLIDLLTVSSGDAEPIVNIRMVAEAGAVEGLTVVTIAEDFAIDFPGSADPVNEMVNSPSPGIVQQLTLDRTIQDDFQVRIFDWPAFIPGDANGNGAVALSDVISTLQYLFQNGVVPCVDSLDVDGSGSAALADAIFTLQYLFTGGPPPPEGTTCEPRIGSVNCDTTGC